MGKNRYEYPEYLEYLQESRFDSAVKTVFLSAAMGGLIALLVVLI